MFDLSSVLKLLPAVGPVVAALPEFKKIFDQIVATFDDPRDQNTLKSAYVVLMRENDEGHRRVQSKLDAASKR